MTLFALIVGLLGAVGLGTIGAALLARRPASHPFGAESLGASLLIGVAATSWCLYAWSFVGGRLSPAVSWTLSAAGGCGLLLMWFRHRRCGSRQALRQPAGSNSALATVGRGAVVAILLVALAQTLLTPQRFWDERAIFAIKGKVLFLDGTVQSASLAHPDFVHGHPRYPLLLPLAEAHVYELLGGIDDRWSKSVVPVLFAGLALTFAGVLNRHFGRGYGWLFALLLVTTPVLFPYELGVLSAQADAPVACLHGAAALFLWDLLRGEQRGDGAAGSIQGERSSTARLRASILIGFLAASAAFTKDEGIAFLICDGAAFTVAWAWGRQRCGRPGAVESSRPRFPLMGGALSLIVAAGAAGILLGPWFWHRRTLPLATEMQYFDRLSAELLVERLDAVRWLVPHLLRRMLLEWREWGLQWWMLPAALATMPRRALDPAQLFLLLNILGGLAALIVAGMIAPADLHEHIGGSSHRYLMQLAPSALLYAAGQWGRQQTHA